jgi:hypothetical protein
LPVDNFGYPIVSDAIQRNNVLRERRARHMAQQQGLLLRKSRRRDPHAIDYHACYLIDPSTNTIVAGGDGSWNVSDVEMWLREPYVVEAKA